MGVTDHLLTRMMLQEESFQPPFPVGSADVLVGGLPISVFQVLIIRDRLRSSPGIFRDVLWKSYGPLMSMGFLEFGDEIWWKIKLKIHNRADVISFVRSHEKLHSKIPLISITLLIKKNLQVFERSLGVSISVHDQYIVIGSHITGLNPVWDSRGLDVLCKFYFHRFGVFFVGPCLQTNHFGSTYVTLLIHNHSRGGTTWKNAFLRRPGIQNYFPQLHWLFARWSCGFLPIATVTDLHTWQVMAAWRIIPVSKWLVTPIYKPFSPFGRGTTLLRGTYHSYYNYLLIAMILQVSENNGNIWDKNHAPQSPHTQIESSIFCRFQTRVACWPVCNFSFLEVLGQVHQKIDFKRVSVEGNILPALWILVVCTTPAFEIDFCCSHILLCCRKKSCASWYAWNLVNL